MVEDTRHAVWLDSLVEKRFNHGGPCKRCQHCILPLWLCSLRDCYVEPNGPNEACPDFDLRRQFGL